jgi:predicted ATP-grasp superfamily ATP-dependent carboligase
MTVRQHAGPCVLLAEEVWGSALQAMRSLGRAGVPVLVVTAGDGAAIYRRSRYCTDALDVAPGDPRAFCARVLEWLEDRADVGADVPIIPLSDRMVEYLDAGRDLFEGRARLSIPPPELTTALLDKAASLALAGAAGLEVPPWVRVDSPDALSDLPTLRGAIALRPTSWSTAGSEYFKIAVAADPDQAARLATEALDRGATLIAQEYIDAPDEAVELSITWSGAGHRPAVCTGRKRRQSDRSGGVMVWGQAELLADVRDASAAFLSHTGYEGLGGLEFIRSGDHLWFIEFNPRLEAIHFLAARAGVDTVLMEYARLAGTEVAPAPAQRPATAWIGSAWLARLMSNPSDWRGALEDRIDFGRSPRRVRAVVSREDPMPAVALTGRLASRGLASTRRRLGAS